MQDRYADFDLGNSYFRHYPNKNWVYPNKFQLSGLRGECLAFTLGQNTKKFTIENFVKNNLSVFHSLRDKDIQFLIYSYEQYLNVDKRKILTIEEQSKLLRLVLTQHGDSILINAENNLIHFYSIFNEYHLLRLAALIPADIKRNRRLTIALIKEIGGTLQQYPFLSHRRTKINSIQNIYELKKQKTFMPIMKITPNLIHNFVNKLRNDKCNPSVVQYIKEHEIVEHNKKMMKMLRYPNVYTYRLNRLFSALYICDKYGIS